MQDCYPRDEEKVQGPSRIRDGFVVTARSRDTRSLTGCKLESHYYISHWTHIQGLVYKTTGTSRSAICRRRNINGCLPGTAVVVFRIEVMDSFILSRHESDMCTKSVWIRAPTFSTGIQLGKYRQYDGN